MMGNCLKTKTKTSSSLSSPDISERKNDFVISIIGLDDAGKTTTVKVLKSDKDLTEVQPTVGYEPHDIKYNSKIITLYDLGGSERVRDIWKHYLSESYGFIYVMDCANRGRINQNRGVFSSFVENEKVAGKPILILGNKQDQQNALDESEIVQYLNVEELANKFEIPCRIETCYALNGIGSKMDKSVKVGFEWLFKHIVANYEELKKRVDHDVGKQRSEEIRQKRERSERVRQRREYENPSYDDDKEDDAKNGNPWKRLDDLQKKETKLSTSSKISAYDRQLLDEMDPNKRLSTISEIDKSKSKMGLRNNKLVPLDDRNDIDQNKSKQNYSWALVEAPKSKTALPALASRSKYDF